MVNLAVNLAVARDSKNEPRRMGNYNERAREGRREGQGPVGDRVSIWGRAFFHNIGRTGFVNPAAARVWPRARFAEPLPPMLERNVKM